MYRKQEMLNQAGAFYELSLEMLRTVHARNLQDPNITVVADDLADIYEDQGRRDEALAIRLRYEENTDTDRRSGGIASSYVGIIRYPGFGDIPMKPLWPLLFFFLHVLCEKLLEMPGKREEAVQGVLVLTVRTACATAMNRGLPTFKDICFF